MKKRCLIIAALCLAIASFGGCDNSVNDSVETAPPTELTFQVSQFDGMPYYDVYNLLEDNGFTNIMLNPLDDLSSKDKDRDDIVEYITINGNSTIQVGDTYMSNDPVRIFYHNIKKLFLPFSSDELEEGQLHDEIKQQFEDAGFTNIISEPIEDLVFGLLTEDGAIEEIVVDGKKEFNDYDMVAYDAEIIIKYHTFPSSEQDTNGEETVGNEETESEASSEILTIDNNEDLAKLLSLKNESDPFIQEFADKYKGRTIEFDGNIAYMAKHGNYNTRYDFLIGTSDYNANSQQGPNFRFEDVNASDLGLDTLFMEDVLWIGVDVHVVAVVGEYNQNNTLFELDPVLVSVR